jgi:hypothetical protein
MFIVAILKNFKGFLACQMRDARSHTAALESDPFAVMDRKQSNSKIEATGSSLEFMLY